MKYLKKTEQGIYEHNIWAAFFYGITFAICVLTCMRIGLPICVGIIVISICLFVKKKWQNLFQNAGMFILGCALMLIPYLIYFMINNAINDFWYSIFWFNLEYAKVSKTPLIKVGLSLKTYIHCILCWLPAIGLIVTGIDRMIKKKLIYGWFYLLIGISSLYFLMAENLYFHYAQMLVPYVLILICEFKFLDEKMKRKIFTSIVVIYAIAALILETGTQIHHLLVAQKDEPFLVESLEDQVPGNDSLIFYDCDSSFYVKNNRIPYYKFFSVQKFFSECSPKLKSEIHEEYASGNVKWIFLRNHEHVAIADILEHDYKEVDRITSTTGQTYILYKRNQK